MKESKQITLRLPTELYEQVRAEAEREGLSVNTIALQAFNYYVVSNELDRYLSQTDQHV